MQAYKRLYGEERLEIEDLFDSKIDHLVELAYYKIKNVKEATKQYAVEIVKTEYLENKLKVESEKANLFTDNETKANNILEILKKNKVTPMGLKETMIEIAKRETI